MRATNWLLNHFRNMNIEARLHLKILVVTCKLIITFSILVVNSFFLMSCMLKMNQQKVATSVSQLSLNKYLPRDLKNYNAGFSRNIVICEMVLNATIGILRKNKLRSQASTPRDWWNTNRSHKFTEMHRRFCEILSSNLHNSTSGNMERD